MSTPVAKVDRLRHDTLNGFWVDMRQADSPTKFGTNGRAVKMVPASEVVKRKAPSSHNTEIINGSKRLINGASPLLVNSQTSDRTKYFEPLPPLEELKVLPSDEGFSWANENYSSLRRSVDVWSFVLSLRIHILFDNAKWAYAGGFTEDKQVCFSTFNILVLAVKSKREKANLSITSLGSES